MSTTTYLLAMAGMTAVGVVAAIALTRGQPIQRRLPVEVEVRTGEAGADSLFAGELHAIGVDLAAEANYTPVHLTDDPEPGEPEPADAPEPEVTPAPEHETEVSPDEPSWWGFPPAAQEQRWTASPDEPTPLFSAPGKHRYPDDLDQESFTDTWNRAELLDRIRRVEAQQAGVEAA